MLLLLSLIIFATVCAEPPPPREYQAPFQGYQQDARADYERNSGHYEATNHYDENRQGRMNHLQNLGLLDNDVAHQLDSNGWQDSVPGTPGQDYPNLDYIPETSFSCADKTSGGYYADVETRCQVFHVCGTGGTKSSFLCPSGSIFNQKYFVCDWWYDFECDNALELYSLNDKLNRGSAAALPRNSNQNYGQSNNANGQDLRNREFPRQYQDGGNTLNDAFDLSLASTGEGGLGYQNQQSTQAADYQINPANGRQDNNRPFKNVARDLQSNRRFNDQQARGEKSFEKQPAGGNYLPPGNNDQRYDSPRNNDRQQPAQDGRDRNLDSYQSPRFDKPTYESSGYDPKARGGGDQPKQSPDYLPPQKEDDSIPRGFSFNYGKESGNGQSGAVNTNDYYDNANRGYNDDSAPFKNDRRSDFALNGQYLVPKRNEERQSTIYEINRSTELTGGTYSSRNSNCYDRDRSGKCGVSVDNGNFGEKYPSNFDTPYRSPSPSNNERNQLGSANKFPPSLDQGYKFDGPKLDQPRSSSLAPYAATSNDLSGTDQPPKPEYSPVNDYSTYSQQSSFDITRNTGNRYSNSFPTPTEPTGFRLPEPDRSYLAPNLLTNRGFLGNLPRFDGPSSSGGQYLAPNNDYGNLEKDLTSERPPYPPLTTPTSTTQDKPEEISADDKDQRSTGGFRDGLGNGFPSINNKELPGSTAVAGTPFPDFATSERPNYPVVGTSLTGGTDQGFTKVVVTPSPTYLPDSSRGIGSLGKPIISVQITSGSRAPGQITGVSTGFVESPANLSGSRSGDFATDQKDFRQGDNDFNAGNEPFGQHQYRFQEGTSRTRQQYLPPLSDENSLPSIERNTVFNDARGSGAKQNKGTSSDSPSFDKDKDQYLPPTSHAGDSERTLDNGHFIPNIQDRYLPVS